MSKPELGRFHHVLNLQSLRTASFRQQVPNKLYGPIKKKKKSKAHSTVMQVTAEGKAID